MPQPAGPAGVPSRESPSGLPADREAVDLLFSQAYEELRRLAATVHRNEAATSLSPTGLVHEAWLKLAGSPGIAQTSHAHFKRIAARAMRQVLIEAARRRLAGKRGGGMVRVVTLDEGLGDGLATDPIAGDGLTSIRSDRELVGLDEALTTLERLEPRQAQMVESRFFGGLTVAETAGLLGVSEATVLRDWRVARAWLARELRGRG